MLSITNEVLKREGGFVIRLQSALGFLNDFSLPARMKLIALGGVNRYKDVRTVGLHGAFLGNFRFVGLYKKVLYTTV